MKSMIRKFYNTRKNVCDFQLKGVSVIHKISLSGKEANKSIGSLQTPVNDQKV